MTPSVPMTRARRAATGSRRDSQASDGFKRGSIVWLRPKHEVDPLLLDTNLGEGCFDHPVIVLSTSPGAVVTILLVTSFVGRDLQERFSCSRALRKQYLPIYPSAVHPDNGLQLFLQNNAELPKKSFVNTEHAYNVNCGLLRPFHQDEYCLSDESYTTLVQYMGLPLPSPMHPTLPVLNTPPVGTGMAAPLRDTRTPTRSRREQIPLLPPPNRVHAVPQPWQEEPSSKGHGSLSALLVLGSITVVAWIGYKMFFGRA